LPAIKNYRPEMLKALWAAVCTLDFSLNLILMVEYFEVNKKFEVLNKSGF
jgi:hypothetical protein